MVIFAIFILKVSGNKERRKSQILPNKSVLWNMFNMGIQVEIKTFRTLIDTISNIKYQLLSTIVSYISSIFFNIYQLDQSTNVLATIILFKNVPSGPNSTLLSLFFLFCLLLSRSFLLSSRFLNLSFLRCCFDISTKESAVVFEYQ